MTADIGLVMELVFDITQLGTVTSAIRMFRVIRLFRLVRFLQGLSQLAQAFLLSIPKLMNVA